MFQSFDDTSDTQHTPTRLIKLGIKLADMELSAFMVPRADAHMGEYVAKRDERLSYISGFTGSAGLAIIRENSGVLFVDGRYTLQAREQVLPDFFEIVEIPQTSVADWIKVNFKEGETLGLDPWLTTASALETYQKALEEVGASLKLVEENLIDTIWADQPEAPKTPITPYPVTLAGESAADKLKRIQEKLIESGADGFFTNLPDEIAWTFNIRGSDIPHTPVALGFGYIPKEGKAELYFPLSKVNFDLKTHCDAAAKFIAIEEMRAHLETLKGKKIALDERFVPIAIKNILETAGAEIINLKSPITLLKAQKNGLELKGFRNAHLRDGAAVCHFLQWLDERIAHESEVDEITACKKLEDFRSETGRLVDISFDTISGSGPNGAIVHYRVNKTSNRKLEKGELFLIDSGAQYEDGTTDITRTVAIGEPDDEMKRLYTLVLKGHIALSRARFPKGTTGAQLDLLARQFLWAEELDYAHGTGHGVGHYLSVHEGPASISKRGTEPLLPGMVLSNEPGYYREGAFGIRLENLIVVKELSEEWLGFEALTLAPFDRRLIVKKMLSGQEIDWLNHYHAEVREKIGPLLPEHQGGRDWLERATAPL